MKRYIARTMFECPSKAFSLQKAKTMENKVNTMEESVSTQHLMMDIMFRFVIKF